MWSDSPRRRSAWILRTFERGCSCTTAGSETTHARTLQALVYEQLPTATGKGKAEPLRLWRAVGPRTRFGSYFERPSVSPFVGRYEEKKLLEEIFERCARDSSTHLVTL